MLTYVLATILSIAANDSPRLVAAEWTQFHPDGSVEIRALLNRYASGIIDIEVTNNTNSDICVISSSIIMTEKLNITDESGESLIYNGPHVHPIHPFSLRTLEKGETRELGLDLYYFSGLEAGRYYVANFDYPVYECEFRDDQLVSYRFKDGIGPHTHLSIQFGIDISTP